MERESGQFSDGQLLAALDAVLDALSDDRLRLPTDGEQLALLQENIRVGARLSAWQQRLAAQIESSEAA